MVDAKFIFCAFRMQVIPAYNYTHSSSVFYNRGMPRYGSPPWRPDDKDGHYVFVIGENLTSRCKHIQSL